MKIFMNVFCCSRHCRIRVNCLFYVRLLCSYFQGDLPNMTWHEVQTKLLDVQKEQQMCIHKTELTQLGNLHSVSECLHSWEFYLY